MKFYTGLAIEDVASIPETAISYTITYAIETFLRQTDVPRGYRLGLERNGVESNFIMHGKTIKKLVRNLGVRNREDLAGKIVFADLEGGKIRGIYSREYKPPVAPASIAV